MIYNNIEEMSGNCYKKNVNFIIQVILNSLKQKMAVKTCMQQKYARYDLLAECTHGGTKQI